MTVLEAMACGVPVLASAVDGVREIVTPGEHALLAPSENVEVFRAELKRLLSEPDLRLRLAANARKLVEDRFDARTLAAELEKLYLQDLGPAAHIS